MELNNNINNNRKRKTNIDWSMIIFLAVIMILALITVLNLTKKENYEIINIANNELIYQNKNTIETISIDYLKITIDNTRKTPLLIKDNMGYKELLINEEDFNKYFKGE